jgi:hypothetical protein
VRIRYLAHDVVRKLVPPTPSAQALSYTNLSKDTVPGAPSEDEAGSVRFAGNRSGLAIRGRASRNAPTVAGLRLRWEPVLARLTTSPSVASVAEALTTYMPDVADNGNLVLDLYTSPPDER